MRIWEELRNLSGFHLEAAREEDWAKWEKILAEKKAIYKQIESLKRTPLTQEEKSCLREIKALEEEVQKELLNKKEETRLKIIHFKKANAGTQGYRQGVEKGGKRRISIRC